MAEEKKDKGQRKGEVDLKRYFKDEEYRRTLGPEQLAGYPKNPAGEIDPTDEVITMMRPSLKTNPDCYSARTSIQGCGCKPPEGF